jgi:hypothetical protein
MSIRPQLICVWRVKHASVALTKESKRATYVSSFLHTTSTSCWHSPLADPISGLLAAHKKAAAYDASQKTMMLAEKLPSIFSDYRLLPRKISADNTRNDV